MACAYGSVALAPAAPFVGAPVSARLEEFDPLPEYKFGYSVSDALTGDYKTQDEQRDGELVRGRYTVVDPDNTLRTVDYTADPVNGFNAVVRNDPLVGEAVVPAAPVAPARYVASAAAPVYANYPAVASARYAIAPAATTYAVAPAPAPARYAVAQAPARYAVAQGPVAAVAPARYSFAPAPARYSVSPAAAFSAPVAYASPYTAAYTAAFPSAAVTQYTATGPVAAYTQYPAPAAYYAAPYSAAPVAAAPAKLVNAAPAVSGYRYA